MNNFIGGAVVVAIVGFILWLFIYVPLFGLHINTGKGEHTGYITSTEKSGLIFKTNTAYLKTDTQSSQEDSYCVIDEDVFNQLQQVAKDKSWVNVYYYGLFSAGISNCAGEGAIIYKVEVINK